jgi:hypothetical protein
MFIIWIYCLDKLTFKVIQIYFYIGHRNLFTQFSPASVSINLSLWHKMAKNWLIQSRINRVDYIWKGTKTNCYLYRMQTMLHLYHPRSVFVNNWQRNSSFNTGQCDEKHKLMHRELKTIFIVKYLKKTFKTIMVQLCTKKIPV